MHRSAVAIPFNRPCFVGTEPGYISEALERRHISGDGIFTQRCQQLLERQLSIPKAFLTTSCTHALEMAGLLLDLRAGDEVIVPAFTFVSTANAFALRGARLVFADIRPDTLNLDEVHLESLITERTKAIVVVHYGGVACEMEPIMATAARHKIPVIEDNAHGLFAKYRGAYLGTFGAVATQSFHETKNFTCGEGGALLINDDDLIERAEIIREKGTNRRRFLKGEVDKYTWVSLGSSYLPSDILAAHLYAQLEARDKIQSRRKTIWDAYFEGLAKWAETYEFQRPYVPADCEQGYHTFYLLAPNQRERDALIRVLRTHGISSVFHYAPLHRSEMGRRVAARQTDCPVTDSVSARLLRLPFYYSLSDEEQERVIASVQNYDR